MVISNGVQQIKERLSIEEIVSSYLKLDKAGANFKAKCPFHNEKTPSFFVSPDRNSYYCFGCGAKGDIFTFVEEFEGLDFKGALKILAERAGITLKEFSKEKMGDKDRLYETVDESASFFEENLTKNEEALKYLKQRGLGDKTIKDFRIGFAENNWHSLFFYLKNKGFTDIEMEKAGMIKKSEKIPPSGGSGFYDRFRGRIIFPICDSSGRVIAFSGRILKDDGESAKYLNSPDTPIFNKSAVFYGLDKAKNSIRKNNFSILVEGQMDLVLSHQAGFKNTIATSGTALTDSLASKISSNFSEGPDSEKTPESWSKENIVSNLGLLRRLSSNIVLAFDADGAGFNASMRAGRISLALGMDVKVASLPNGIDPADLILKHGINEWRAAIRNSKHIVEFVLGKVLRNYEKDTRRAGREIREKVLPYVDAIESSIEKAGFIRKISDLSQIREDALREDLVKIEKESGHEKTEIEKARESQGLLFRRDYIERRLLGILFWQAGLREKTIDTDKITKELEDILNVSISELLVRSADDKEDLIFEAEVFYGGDAYLEKDAEELLTNLKEEHLKEKLFKKIEELRSFEAKKDFHGSRQILTEINEINKSIQDIKNGLFKN